MILMLVFAFLFDWYKDGDPGYVNFDIYLFVIAYIPLIRHLKTVYNNKEPRLLDPELKKLAISTFLISLILSLSLIYFFTDIIVQIVNATINHYN
jgi:1,4-dihydroxy-2-naphthoate octaprenyltransferase